MKAVELKNRPSAPKESTVPKPSPVAAKPTSTSIAPAEPTVIVERKTIPKRDRDVNSIPDSSKTKKQKGKSLTCFF